MIPGEIKIPVIYYHSVAPRKNLNWRRNFLTLETKYFQEHLKFFSENNYKSLFLSEYFYIKRSGKKPAGNYFCLTFDDGYLDNFVYAFPLLKKYGIKATIFINPEFTDKRNIVRNNLDDYWNNKVSLGGLEHSGFLSWQEMILMEESGFIDIQSHSLTHNKYFVSDKLTGFHHPGADCLYTVGSLFPDRKPYYISDPEFEKLIPYGYPVFEERSSVIARRIFISESFNSEIAGKLKNYRWTEDYDFKKIFLRIEELYNEYKKSNNIISSVETETEYQERVCNELTLSKEIIEKNLNKNVDFLCWPHGDNNNTIHKMALDAGYKATSAGKITIDKNDTTRFDRFGSDKVMNNLFLTRLKLLYKVKSYTDTSPYSSIRQTYEYFRDRL